MAAAIGLHPVPEMQMVVVLARIVEQRGVLAERAFDDLFEGLALEFGAFQQVVAVGHVGLMMLVVMIFQCFLGHMGLQGIIGVRKGGKREGHGVMSENGGRRGLTATLIEGSIGIGPAICENVAAASAGNCKTSFHGI